MDTQTLKTFLTLANVKNFTQTARLMYIAQSTVTNRIAELEKEVGKPLFIRSKKNISLTREGLLFLDYARRILDLEDLAVQELNSPAFSRTPLRIGTTNTIYECYLEPVLLELLKTDSRYAVSLIISHSVSLLQSLQDGLLDLVFTYEPLQRPGFRCQQFRTDRLLLVTSPANALRQGSVRREELSALNYLFCNFALQEVGQFIRELFPPLYQFSFEIDNSTKLLRYLREGIGYSFLPEGLVRPYLEDGTLSAVRLVDFEVTLPLILVLSCLSLFASLASAAAGAAVRVKRRVKGVEVLGVQLLLDDAQGLTETLEMHDLPGPQEADRVRHIRRIHGEPQDIVIGGPGLLFRSLILAQIRNRIPGGLEHGSGKRHPRRRLGPQAQGVIHVVIIEAGRPQLLHGHIAGELVDDGCNHFKVPQLIRAGRLVMKCSSEVLASSVPMSVNQTAHFL